MKAQISRLHYQPLPAWLYLLLPLEWGYGLLSSLKVLAYQWGFLSSYTLTVPVISVGNLSTGGTGKTPIVLSLCQALHQAGKKVVVLSRGYGAKKPLLYGRADHPDHGDEAFLLQEALGDKAVVIVGKDRVNTGKRAILEFNPDVIVLDDGFQHLRLQRSINLLLVDGEQGFGNQHLLPLGPLRESFHQIARATHILMTKQGSPETVNLLETYLRSFKQCIPLNTVPFKPTGFKNMATQESVPLNTFSGQEAVIFSGIAQPLSFETTLIEQAGVKVLKHFQFSDHHPYSDIDIKTIFNVSNPNSLWLTTEKDRVKIEAQIPAADRTRIYTLLIEPQWEAEAVFVPLFPPTALTQ